MVRLLRSLLALAAFALILGCKDNSGGPNPAPVAGPNPTKDPGANPGPSKGVISSDGKFKVEFPVEAKQMNQNAGGINIRIWVYEKTPSEVLMLSVNDLPGPSSGGQAEAVLQKSVEGQFQGMNGKMSASNNIKLAGKYPGKDSSGTAAGMSVKSRIYLVGSKMYQLLILGNPGFLDSPEAKQFFDSFQIVSE